MSNNADIADISDISDVANYKFIVTTSYYKHGEVDQVTYNLEELLHAISKQIKENFKLSVNTNNLITIKGHGKIVKEEQISKFNLFDLIQFSVKLGNLIVEHEYGWGMRYVTMIDDKLNTYTWDGYSRPDIEQLDMHVE